MQSYVLLKKINVQKANAIAGLTYGFPAITNFLGFAHGLSRKLPSKLKVALGGVCIVSHKNDIRAHKPDGFGDYTFSLTRNPLDENGDTSPINEEGCMNMQVSLLIEVVGDNLLNNGVSSSLKAQIQRLLPTMRLAGGLITDFESCEVITDEVTQRKAIRTLAPGFVLFDRSEYLEEHFSNLKSKNDNASLFDAWCDFVKLKYKATPFEGLPTDDREKATWGYVPKPNSAEPKPGYLIPIASGYYAISELYEPGVVDSVRDNSVPVTFAETAYSVGEWRSVSCIRNINDAVWKYTNEHPWYLVKTDRVEIDILEPDVTV